MRFIDLFAGIGGFHLGLTNASDKFKCVYSNEWDKYASLVYRKHYGKCDTTDITMVSTTGIPDHELLVGGFPCQAFSIAGKRRGFDDTRGTLFFEIARILKDKQPKYFILENVKGLLSHDSGNTFKTIIATLTELGYDVQWQVLNSKNFGVPQNRERVFIVGNLRGESRPEIFPIAGPDKEAGRENKSNAIDANYFKGIDNHGQRTFIIHNVYGGFKEGIRVFDEYSPALRTPAGGGHIPFVALTEARSEEAKRIRRENLKNGIDWSPRREKVLVPRTDGKVGTITSTKNFDLLLTDGISIRKLTPTECERLQGFPDDYTKFGVDEVTHSDIAISDSQRYKMLGNAVTTNVITAIARELLKVVNKL